MALGIVFLFLRRQYTDDAFTYLFGSVLAVTRQDLWFAGTMTLVTSLTGPFWRRWAYASFDRELAQTDRLSVATDDYLLGVLIALTVVISIKIVGIVLIAAFLVIPAATARLLCKTFSSMTVLSIICGTLSVVVGLWASYHLDVPSGATIILVQAAFFFSALLLHLLRGER
jgi:zinc transport system permease protein